MSRDRRTIWQVGALAAISLNMSLAMSEVSPLLPTIRRDLGLTAADAGLLTTIPFFCMGALAPFAPRLARRFGAERVIGVGLAALAAGVLIRSGPGLDALYGGTVLLGAAGCAVVLIPGVIKRRFGQRSGQMVGVYSTAGLVGSVLGAGATVPLMHALGWGWRATLALWATVAVITMLVWLPQLRGAEAPNALVAPPPRLELRRLYRDHVAWQVALYYGVQNLVYNGAVAWIPSLFVAHGVSQSDAGLLLAIVNLTGMIATFGIPLLAMRRPSQGPLVVATVAMLAVGLLGLLTAPVAGAVAWMVIFGLGQGAAFSLGLSLILLRSSDAQHATELSGMTLTVGFLFSAVGPFGVGVVYDISGGWTWPVVVLLLLLVPLLVIGLGASKDRHVLLAPAAASSG